MNHLFSPCLKSIFILLFFIGIKSMTNAQQLNMHSGIYETLKAGYLKTNIYRDLAKSSKVSTEDIKKLNQEIIAFNALLPASRIQYMQVVLDSGVENNHIKIQERDIFLRSLKLMNNGRFSELKQELIRFSKLKNKSDAGKKCMSVMNNYAKSQGHPSVDAYLFQVEFPEIIDIESVMPDFGLIENEGLDFGVWDFLLTATSSDIMNSRFSNIGVLSATGENDVYIPKLGNPNNTATNEVTGEEEDDGYGAEEAYVAGSTMVGAMLGASLAGAVTMGSGAGVGAALGAAAGTFQGLVHVATYKYLTSDFMDPCLGPNAGENCIPNISF